jgi:hypothetical protein
MYEVHNIKGIQAGIPGDMTNTSDGLKKRTDILLRILRRHNNELIDFIDANRYIFENRGMRSAIISEFISTREDLRRIWNDILYDVKNVGETMTVNISDLKKLLLPHRLFMNTLNIDLIKGSMLLAKPYNIHKKIPESSSLYVSLYNPHIDTILSIAPNDTFVDSMYYQSYIFNLNENIDYGNMNMIMNITINDMKLLANIYNKKEMARKFSDMKINSQKLHVHMQDYLNKQYQIFTATMPQAQAQVQVQVDFRQYSVPDHTIGVMNIRKTVESSKQDIENIQNDEIWKIMQGLGVGHANYGKLIR